MLADEYIVQQAEMLVGFEARGGNPHRWYVSKDFYPEDAAAIRLTAEAIRAGRFSPTAWAAGNAIVAAVLAQVTASVPCRRRR